MEQQEDFKPEITAIQVQVSRTSKGLFIKCRTNKKIEDFFRNLSGGGRVQDFDVRVSGRYWQPVDEANPIIRLYEIDEQGFNQPIPLNQPPYSSYVLHMPGRKLVDIDASGRHFVNISFLRAVGIAENGIEFYVKGVFSPDQCRLIRDGILYSVNTFCDHFLAPVNFTINLIEG